MQDYTYSSPGADPATGTFLLASVIVTVVIYLIVGFILSKVFAKASKPGWAGFVPIYNTWILFEIAGKPGWWSLFILIPYVGSLIYLVLYIIAALEIAKRFGKSSVFGIFGLWLFSLIGYTMLAFDNSKYQAGAPVAAKATPTPATTDEVVETKTDDTPPPPLVQ